MSTQYAIRWRIVATGFEGQGEYMFATELEAHVAIKAVQARTDMADVAIEYWVVAQDNAKEVRS